MNMAIATEEENPLVLVFQPINIATWDLVPMKPVGHKKNRILILNFQKYKVPRYYINSK